MRIICLILALFFGVNVISQEEITSESRINKNSVYLEVGGNSGNLTRYSLNYERLITIDKNKSKDFSFNLRFGYGYYNRYWDAHTFPFELIFHAGIKNNFFEWGFGPTYLIAFYSEGRTYESFVYFLRIGYRHVWKKGLLLRVGFTPVIDPSRNFYTNRFPLNPVFGISFGYSF